MSTRTSAPAEWLDLQQLSLTSIPASAVTHSHAEHRSLVMIISHRHRFIFIRTEKTGSTSVTRALRTLCGSLGDAKDDPTDFVRGRRGSLRRLFPKTFGLWYHSDASQIRSVLGDERFSSYFKFSIVRNPWDAQISLYAHRLGKDAVVDQTLFERRLRSPLWCAMHHSRLRNWQIYSMNGKPCVNYMMRFENLAEDFAEVLRRIGAPADIGLGHHRFGNRDDKGDYRRWYTPSCQELVHEWYRPEIAEFKYQF